MSQPEQIELNDDPAVEVPPPPPALHLRVARVLTVVAVIGALAATFYYRDRLEELKGYGYAAVFLAGLISNAT